MNTLLASYGYLRVALSGHAQRLRDARTAGDRGASAVELAVITAVILGIALTLLFVIKNFVTSESSQIQGGGGGGGGGGGN
jgi:hypothetical protein